MKQSHLLSGVGLAIALLAGCTQPMGTTQPSTGTSASSTASVNFKLHIQDVAGTFTGGNGASYTVFVSPGVWVTQTKDATLFTAGQPDRGQGLALIAQGGDTSMLAASLKNMVGQNGIVATGAFTTATGKTAAGPLMPGDAFDVPFTAAPGQALNFAVMFGQSRDCFFAPSEKGIALFDASNKPTTGDVTSQVSLWDAGTKADADPAAIFNKTAIAAVAESKPVTMVNGSIENVTFPAVSSVIKVTLSTM